MKIHGQSLEAQLERAQRQEKQYVDAAHQSEARIAELQREIQNLSLKSLESQGVAAGGADKDKLAQYEQAARTCVPEGQ